MMCFFGFHAVATFITSVSHTITHTHTLTDTVHAHAHAHTQRPAQSHTDSGLAVGVRAGEAVCHGQHVFPHLLLGSGQYAFFLLGLATRPLLPTHLFGSG